MFSFMRLIYIYIYVYMYIYVYIYTEFIVLETGSNYVALSGLELFM